MKKIDWNSVLKIIKTVSVLSFLGSIIYAFVNKDTIDNGTFKETVLPAIIIVFSIVSFSITSSFVKKK